MPSATDEQRDQWDDDDNSAEKYLKDRGYTLDDEWNWNIPVAHKPTAMEISAVDYLIDEWDYGGFKQKCICSRPTQCGPCPIHEGGYTTP